MNKADSEARVIFTTLARESRVLALGFFLGLALGFTGSILQAESYSANALIYIKPEEIEMQGASDQYRKVGFNELTETFASLLGSAEVQETSDVSFRVKKIAPSVIRLSVVSETEEEVRTNLQRATRFSKLKFRELVSPDNGLSLIEISGGMKVARSKAETLPTVAVSGLLGLLLGAVFAALRGYFRAPQN